MKSAALSILCGLALGCSLQTKDEVAEAEMDEQDRRLEIMETTLRVLDENPEYVDELFKLTLRHKPTLDRFLANMVVAVEDPERAARVARHLVTYPRGLRRVVIETLDAARWSPGAQHAIVDALEDRAKTAAEFLVDQPAKLVKISQAVVQAAVGDPETKDKLLEIVSELVD